MSATPHHTRLHSAGRIASAFLESKLTIVLILASLLLGLLALWQTPREENPQIQVMGALVMVALPGAPPSEVEELLVTPLEGILKGMVGVKHTEGLAQSGMALVQVSYEVGEEKESALVRLYDRVLSNSLLLPAGASAPFILSSDVDDVPIVSVTLAANTYNDTELLRMAERMAERLYSVKGVSTVEVRGGQDRELRIEIDPVRLQAFQLTLAQIEAMIQAANQSLTLSRTVKNNEQHSVRSQGFFIRPEDAGNLVIGVQHGRPVYLRDVGDILDGTPRERDRLSRLAFGAADARRTGEEMPAVTIAVAKQKGTNAVVVASDVLARMEQMRQAFVPQDVHMVVTRNDGQKANDAVNMLLEHLVIAIVSVGLVLIPLLGWRDALVVMGTVPLIFSLTLGADYFGGVTINRITLYALILSMGLLVDAAIVVLENIHRHYRLPSDKTKQEISILATNEIGNATNLATFAIMLVFASLLLVTDMAGDYFYPVAFNVPIAMAASLVIAYIVVPWAANRWLPLHNQNVEAAPGPDRLQHLYLRIFAPLERKGPPRWIFFGLICLLICVSLLQASWQFVRPSGVDGPTPPFGVPLGFLPKNNNNTFNVVVTMPENTPIEETDRFVRELGQQIGQSPYVVHYQSWLGMAGVTDFNAMIQGNALRQGSHVAEIRVNLLDKTKRQVTSIEIVRQIRPELEAIRLKYPHARLRLVEDPPGPPMRASVLAQIHGADLDGLRKLARTVEEAFAKTYDMVDISTSEPMDIVEQRIFPDKEKAALSGVTVAQITDVLQWAYGGRVIGRFHPEDEKRPVPIRVLIPRRHEVDPACLDRLYVSNIAGQPVPLSSLVSIEKGTVARPIRHIDTERVIVVGGELASAVPLYSVIDLNQRLDGMTAPDGKPVRTGNLRLIEQVPDSLDGYLILWGGEMRITLDVYRDMFVALGVSLLLVYLLLVAYYRSFRIPLIAMSSVPLGAIGILPGHWLLGVDFSATSIVGTIALAGVVVRNSLLILDFILDNLRQGKSLLEAARMAGAIRLKPILLTSLAIILGSAIMVTDPVFGGLAISLIFGTISSTVFTIFAVPVLFLKFAPRTMLQE